MVNYMCSGRGFPDPLEMSQGVWKLFVDYIPVTLITQFFATLVYEHSVDIASVFYWYTWR